MSKSGQSALDRLKEITNVHATGRKRKDDADENRKDAKGGPGQGTFGGEGFTEAQLNQLARLIDCSVTSAVEKSVGSLKKDMVEMSSACVGAIEEQNAAMAAMKSEMEDMKTKTSDEHLSKEIQRIVGSAAVRGSSAPPRTSTQIGQENLFCGPRKDLPSYDQRKKDIIYASDKLNMTFKGKIESGDALDLAKKTIENQGLLDARLRLRR